VLTRLLPGEPFLPEAMTLHISSAEIPSPAVMAWLAMAMLFGGFRGPGGPIAKKDHRCAVFLA
jgi:hypothetical protein